MADNFPINDSTTTPHAILTDELSTLNGSDVSTASPRVHAQRVKIMVGADGAANDVTASNPLAISSADGALASIGAQADAEATGNGSAIALLKRIRTLLSDDASYYVNGTKLTVKRQNVNISVSTTDGNIVTAVTGKAIRVLSLVAVAGATATNLTLNSKGAGAGTAISPVLANGPNGGEVLPFNPYGWWETNASEALTATTGTGSTTGISILYVEV